jgi:hypothetical protein
VLTGMVNAGGQRDGELVRYIWTARLHPPADPGDRRDVPRRGSARTRGDRP